MNDPRTSNAAWRRHAPLGIVALTVTLVLLALAGAWELWGAALVEAGHSGRSPLLARVFESELPRTLTKAQRDADVAFQGLMAGLVALSAAGLLAYLTWHAPLPRIAKVASWVAAYLVLELVIAPRLVEPWGLGQFYFVRDPDHRPTATGEGFNRDALRGTPEPETFRAQDCNILFLGDSFTYGAYLPLAATMPVQVEALLEERLTAREPGAAVRVANFGWISASPLLAWRRLVEIGDRYRPDLVAIAIDMTDFQDDIKYASMLERRGLFYWSDKVPVLLKSLERLAPSVFEALRARLNPELPAERFFMTNAPLDETRSAMLPLVENLGRIHAWCAERELPFVVFLLPRNYQYSERESPENWERHEYEPLGPFVHEPFRFFEELAPELPYPVHSLLPAFLETDVFPTCLTWDPYWNPDGAKVAAEAIAELLLPELS